MLGLYAEHTAIRARAGKQISIFPKTSNYFFTPVIWDLTFLWLFGALLAHTMVGVKNISRNMIGTMLNEGLNQTKPMTIIPCTVFLPTLLSLDTVHHPNQIYQRESGTQTDHEEKVTNRKKDSGRMGRCRRWETDGKRLEGCRKKKIDGLRVWQRQR